ncbi:MAG: PorP/SprF family type IX secretion system membrane protein [Bacteroidales bacterium]|nr:PorP/SprF family type IX secretion system membrane protein [Bacteroidales bacterium]
MVYRLKAFLLFFVLFLFLDKTMAQQEQTYAHYMFQSAVFNPSTVGNQSSIQLSGLMRQQWVGLAGAPETFFVNIHAPVSILHGGIGATIINDQIGPFGSTGLKLAYAYRTHFWSGDLSIGFSLGFLNNTINYGYFNVTNDPILTGTAEESGMIFNLDAGLFYEEKNHYYFGISSTQFNQGRMTLEGGSTSLARNIYAHGGYYFKVRMLPQIVFNPTVMLVYTQGAPVQINIGFLGEYNKKFWGGVTYRHQSALGIIAGLYFKQFTASYAYEINMTPLKNGGSHEIMVGYRFLIEIEKGKKSYKNTRYL